MPKKYKGLYKIDTASPVPVALQIVNSIKKNVDKGVLKINDPLPSISEIELAYSLPKESIKKGYKQLKQEGYIRQLKGKGYYVGDENGSQIRVLLIFNNITSFKKVVYDSFVDAVKGKVTVDLQLHHYDPRILKEIIKASVGKYDYYAVMTHFFHEAQKQDYIDVLKLIPQEKLIILDKAIPDFDEFNSGVYQDFENDIYHALDSLKDILNKYDRIHLVLEEPNHHPLEIVPGIKKYCTDNDKKFALSNDIVSEKLKAGIVFIVTTDTELAVLLKKVKDSSFELGKDVGIISFNETILKELLDITVITTDFAQMGKSLAGIVLHKAKGNIKNLFISIVRKSA